MSYLALARKWRPRTFSQLVGQEHINKALIKSLNQQKVHHAYLFTGTRGVGKTSIARLMAKALNCEQGVSAMPCLLCDACISIEQGQFIDLIEIDGASKTRVEDTREILENVQYAPTSGRYKIYLIDEVHMLSQHSFNALLKTLEEPPAHVKFLLATTDPHKIPVTVLSRCLQFNLKHLPLDIISAHLHLILTEEGYPFEEAVLPLLARAAQGSMRDALSLLDQAIASTDNTLRTDDVKAILGYTLHDYALQLLQALVTRDANQLIATCREVARESGHFRYVIDEVVDYLHQITVSQHLPDNHPLLSFAPEIQALAKKIKPEDVQLFYQIGIKGIEEMHLAPSMAIGFEMTMLRMLTFQPIALSPFPQLISETGEAPLTLVPPTTPPTVESATPALPTTPTARLPDASPELAPAIHVSDNSWSHILQQLKLTGLAQNAADNAEMLSKSGRDIVLCVAKGHQSLFTPSVIQRIEQALADYYQENIKITFDFSESVHATPAQKKHIAATVNQQDAAANLEQDPFLYQLKHEFSAELIRNSIESLPDQL